MEEIVLWEKLRAEALWLLKLPCVNLSISICYFLKGCCESALIKVCKHCVCGVERCFEWSRSVVLLNELLAHHQSVKSQLKLLFCFFMFLHSQKIHKPRSEAENSCQ